MLLYAGGYIAQLIYNYSVWQREGGIVGDGTSPAISSTSILQCIKSVFIFPQGIIGLAIIIGLLVLLIVLVMKLGFGDKGIYDSDRNLIYSSKGTYGTSGFMQESEIRKVFDLVSDIKKHKGTILGELDGKTVCVPENSRMNANIAVYGASGTKKTRAYCVNRIFQSVTRGESLIITDSKSELYEKTSEYLRSKNYTVKVFNLVNPENSDSWNCLSEIDGQELMAQLFCDVIIKNTGSERGDHFWDNSELCLLKSLTLYVEQGYPEKSKNMGEVYKLITNKNEKQLNSLFENLAFDHPAKAPYNIFRQAPENVRSGIIIGLGSRLSVFQNKLIKQITAHDEIDLELPGKQKCAYFCITSDQESTFDFLSSLFLSFCFIKLVRYADQYCSEGRLTVPVHILGEEMNACGIIPELSRKISVIRSRNISMSCVFQNLAGLQNRYPFNQWQEILGNCDTQLFLGCTDELTAKLISERTGIASVSVSSKSKMLGTWRVSNYTPEYRETSSVGRRNVLTMDEVLRLPIDKALVIMRGQKVLMVDKYDYSKHPESKKLKLCKASEYIPVWKQHSNDLNNSKPKYKKQFSPKPSDLISTPHSEEKKIIHSDKNSIILKGDK